MPLYMCVLCVCALATNCMDARVQPHSLFTCMWYFKERRRKTSKKCGHISFRNFKRHTHTEGKAEEHIAKTHHARTHIQMHEVPSYSPKILVVMLYFDYSV